MANTFSLFPNLTKSKESPNLKLNKYQLNDQDLKKLTRKVGNRPVVVLSIFGPYRSGKGFLFSLFVKYLAWEVDGREGHWYNSNDKLDAFEWRAGSDGHTIGIQIYNRPLIIKKDDGEEIAILLMDSEGTEDSRGHEISKVLAFSMLVSTLQIYNLNRLVNESNLQLLSVFTEIGAALAGGNTNNSNIFPDLIFLIRDWAYPRQYSFGEKGGKQYIDERLKIEEGQSEDISSIREHMHSTFGQCGGFLLPHPGLGVATDENDVYRTIREMEITPKFLEQVELFFDIVLQQLKATNGKTVFGPDLLNFMQNNAKQIARDDVPITTSLSEGLARKANDKAFRQAKNCYEERIRQQNKKLDDLINGREKVKNVADEIGRIHNKAADAAFRVFDTRVKFNNENITAGYRNDLGRFLETRKQRYLGSYENSMLTAKCSNYKVAVIGMGASAALVGALLAPSAIEKVTKAITENKVNKMCEKICENPLTKKNT